MAIARTAAQDFAGASGTGQTNAFNTSGADCLLVWVWKQQATSASDTCTYNGVSMTLLGNANEGVNGCGQLYLLYNPAAGSNNITFTLAAGSVYIRMIAVAYSGTVASGTTVDGSNFVNTAANSSNITVTAANCWIVAFAVNRTGAPGLGTGVLAAVATASDVDIAQAAYDSNTTVSTGSNAYGATLAVGDRYLAAVSIAPPGAATGTFRRSRLLMGIGQ